MKRSLAGILGAILGLNTAASLAEEVEWKAAAPSRIVPAAPKDSGSVQRLELLAPSEEPKATAAKTTPTPPTQPVAQPPAPEPIGPPRKIELLPAAPEVKPATPPADAKNLRTYNLVCEHALGEEPSPIDPGRRFYFRGEYLLWFTKLMNSPPLLTTAPAPAGSPVTNFGFLGQPGTRVLFGDGPVGDPFHMGARFSAGVWLDDCQSCGLDASYFFLGRGTDNFHADSATFPILTRPIFRVNPPNPQESGQIVAFPPGFTFTGGVPIPDQTGSVDINTSTGLWGAELNARECLCAMPGCCAGYKIDVFAGFRYLDLDDRIIIRENIVLGANNPLIPPLPPGTRVQVIDRFSTHNQFYGGQIGVNGEFRRGANFADLKLSLALGGTAQTVIIEGSQSITPPGQATQTFSGGLLALSSNSGRHTNNEFSVVPEVTLNFGRQLTPGLRVFAGYNFLGWTRVMRASEQIDRVIDVNLVPNFVPPGVFPPIVPPRPRVPFTQNDFWAQGAQLGVELRW